MNDFDIPEMAVDDSSIQAAGVKKMARYPRCGECGGVILDKFLEMDGKMLCSSCVGHWLEENYIYIEDDYDD